MDLLLIVLAVGFILYGIGLLFSPAKGSFIAAVACIGCGVIAYDSHSFLSIIVGFGLLWFLHFNGGEGQVDTRKTTDQSLAYLNSLPAEEKRASIDGILVFLESVHTGEVEKVDAFPLAGGLKEKRMKEAHLRDHRDIAYSSYQLIEDAFLSLYSHKKLISGEYSSTEFVRFLMQNTEGAQYAKAMMVLFGCGFGEIFEKFRKK